MASYRGHLAFSTALGAAYGAASWHFLNVDWPLAGVAGALTALGGLLPDLDSDSGVPVREMFNLAATITPLVLLRRITGFGFSAEETLLAFSGLYLVVRFGLRSVFSHLSVHRGMFHSIPAMLICGLLIYLGYHHPSAEVRGFMAVGTMLGFLSHLVLDELCSVDFRGLVPKLNKYAGTALKLWSPSLRANLACYAMLAGLGYLVYADSKVPPKPLAARKQEMPIVERSTPPNQLRWRVAKPAPSQPQVSPTHPQAPSPSIGARD